MLSGVVTGFQLMKWVRFQSILPRSQFITVLDIFNPGDRHVQFTWMNNDYWLAFIDWLVVSTRQEIDHLDSPLNHDIDSEKYVYDIHVKLLKDLHEFTSIQIQVDVSGNLDHNAGKTAGAMHETHRIRKYLQIPQDVNISKKMFLWSDQRPNFLYRVYQLPNDANMMAMTWLMMFIISGSGFHVRVILNKKVAICVHSISMQFSKHSTHGN